MFQSFRMLAKWTVARFDIRSARGATAVEYAIFVGLIAAVMILAVVFLGRETYKNFQCPTDRGCLP
jgi:Flp pilus assembly pilin Flp